jgi:hypothetical protein
MGPVNSLFVHNISGVPTSTTYTYTRSNRFGAVETRHTTLSAHGVKSSISFSDGHGHVDFLQYRGDSANNSNDYYTGGPQDGFNEGDYSYLYKPLGCKCSDSCTCAINV